MLYTENKTGIIVQKISPFSLSYKLPDRLGENGETIKGKWNSMPHHCPLPGVIDSNENPSFWAEDRLYDLIGAELCALPEIWVSAPDETWTKAKRLAGEATMIESGETKMRCAAQTVLEDYCPFFNPSKLFTYENDVKEFISAKNLLPNTPLRVDEAMWDYWLGVLPPIAIGIGIGINLETCEPHSQAVRSVNASFITGEGIPLIAGWSASTYTLMGVSGDVKISKAGRQIGTATSLFYSR